MRQAENDKRETAKRTHASAARCLERGITTVIVVAFMGVFALIMAALTGFALQESKYGRGIQTREQALSIAEAGIDYYKWYLGHNQSIMAGSANPASPYTYSVQDPESGGEVGRAVVTANVSKQCGIPQWIDISSKGTTDADPTYARTVSVRYMKPSVAAYSNLLQGTVWYEGDVLSGPVASSVGIHMDGTSNSTVSSALSSWYCNSSAGCDGLNGRPTAQNEPGVFGTGSDNRFWQYPVSTVDFSGIAQDLGALQSYAQAPGNLYFYDSAVAKTTAKGWHIIMNGNGTITVREVTGTNSFSAWSPVLKGYVTDYDTIQSESTYGTGTYSIPAGCGLIFVRGTLWLEGTVKGNYTIVAADPTGNFSPDVILSNNISYATHDGTSGLTVIAARSIRIPNGAPNIASYRGIYVAQGGFFGLDYYYNGYTGTRSQLTIWGTVVSAMQPITCWDTPCSEGYLGNTWNYDQVLATQPPPFTPPANALYTTVRWQEK